MIQELHAGDRQIPASGWNEMRAAVQGITPGQQQYQSGKLNPVYITIKNVTGSDLPAFSVVRLSGATYSSRTGDTFINQAIKNGVELNGYTPTAATDTIAITQAACPSGGLVKAMVSGATACMINKAENRVYKYAKPVTSQTGYLDGTDDVTGIRVLWSAIGTGIKEAYILLGYNTQYITTATVYGSTGGSNAVYADINGVTYEILFPNANTGLSGASYPDIYPYDQITVLVDLEADECYAIDYPRDYPEGTIMPWYRPNPWTSPVAYVGRGWQAYVPSGGQGEITAVNIDKNGAHYDAASDCVWVEAGANDKIAVKEGSLCFVEKVKTDAIL